MLEAFELVGRSNERFRPQSIAQIVERARAAQSAVAAWTQKDIDAAVSAVAWHVYRAPASARLNKMAIDETGMGREQDSLARLEKRILGTLRDFQGIATLGLVEDDFERGIRKYAKPIGVVAAITPATSAVAGIVVPALSLLKTRNAAIFCPNPRAKATARHTTQVLREALREVGAPQDLYQCIEEPSRDLATELMQAADLVVATGGMGTVQRARRTGTPAYTAGSGNSVIIVDETADLAAAARMIVEGKTFDNGTSCSSESSIIVARSVWPALLPQLEACGAHLCSASEGLCLRLAVWAGGSTPVAAAVGKSALAISALAGIDVPAQTRALLVEGHGEALETDVMTGEKLCPILGLWLYEDFAQALGLLHKLIDLGGKGHSCGIHSNTAENIEAVSRTAKVSRIMVNQSTSFGNTGDFSNGMPFTVTLSCGTWGGCVGNDNVNWRQFLNHTWVSVPILRNVPSLEVLFGEHWARHGR